MKREKISNDEPLSKTSRTDINLSHQVKLKRKILDKQEKEVLDKIIRVHKHTEARDREEKRLKEANQKLMEKIDEITKIREDIQKAEAARDHYEKKRQEYSMDLRQLEEDRDNTKVELERLADEATNHGTKTEPNDP